MSFLLPRTRRYSSLSPGSNFGWQATYGATDPVVSLTLSLCEVMHIDPEGYIFLKPSKISRPEFVIVMGSFVPAALSRCAKAGSSRLATNLCLELSSSLLHFLQGALPPPPRFFDLLLNFPPPLPLQEEDGRGQAAQKRGDQMHVHPHGD